MLIYRVQEMTCGHCASTIIKAVRAVDAGAKVQIDLARHLVAVESTEVDANAVAQAISEAGYTPVVASIEVAPRQTKKSGCCGCCG